MAKLNEEQIKEELQKKQYTLIDASNYKNMNSRITIKCPHGHLIETSMAEFRHPSFVCPSCDSNIDFINPRFVPKKEDKTFRLIGFDQATEKFGVSIWDNNKLVFYSLLTFSGDMIHRLIKIKKFIEEVVIPQWKPDFIVMEDIQYQQNGLTTYKVLAMLLGLIQVQLVEQGVKYEVVSPNVWRKYAGTCGKNRKEEKILSVAKVKEKYGINVSDDIAEAILIGWYGIRLHPAITKAF